MKTIYKMGFSTLIILLLAILAYAYGGTNPAVHGHSSGELEFPSGAIMAFDLDSCPDGWSEYTAARGRVIVGLNPSDSQFDLRGETGGEKTHTLTIAEMPSHTHPPGTASHFMNVYGSGNGRGTNNPDASFSTETGPRGGDQPHNNLQPYISHIYCKKD